MNSARLVVDTAAAVIIGGELLSGKISDQNVLPLASLLRALGIRLTTVVFVPDDPHRIAFEVARFRDTVGLIVTSGGVGPTHDDVSVEGVARGLGRAVVEDPELVRLLEHAYGAKFQAAHRLMARVPEGSRLACAADISWPAVVAGPVWMFPGVPELFRMKIPILRDHVRGPSAIHGRQVLSSEDELDLKPRLDLIVQSHPEVEVGSYPKWLDPRFKTRVTFDGTDEQAVHAASLEFAAALGPSLVVG